MTSVATEAIVYLMIMGNMKGPATKYADVDPSLAVAMREADKAGARVAAIARRDARRNEEMRDSIARNDGRRWEDICEMFP